MSALRTCDELGLCQARTPRCSGCQPSPNAFAPGIVEGPFPNDRQTRRMMRWVLVWAAATAAAALLAFAAWVLS